MNSRHTPKISSSVWSITLPNLMFSIRVPRKKNGGFAASSSRTRHRVGKAVKPVVGMKCCG